MEDFQESEISAIMKNAALQAMEKIKIYYQKTDAAAFTVATLIDPRLKLFYHEEQKWEKTYIKATKDQFKMLFKEHYYHPGLEAESSDDEVKDEVELYLAAAKLPRKTDILQWWKVK
jgi:hypothetical protein